MCGYVEYFKELGFNQKVENRFELRHYCFAMGHNESDVIGELELNGAKYVQIQMCLSDENEFKLVMKDYLVSYDVSQIKFMIDEYGSKTYINVSDYTRGVNPEKSNISEYNIIYKYIADDEYSSIENTINFIYWLLFLILIIFIIVIVYIILKQRQNKKEEVEERKFWKKKLTKEEKKIEKKKQKNQKRLEKLNKRKNLS